MSAGNRIARAGTSGLAITIVFALFALFALTAIPERAAGQNSPAFSTEIAPVLVANCQRCHNPRGNGYRQHQFDMTTFEGLIKGGQSGKVITPKNGAESLLVKHIKAEDGLAKMPPGGMNNLADVTIEKIEKWINAGALLDAGKSAKDPIRGYAATPEQMEAEKLSKLTPEQRGDRMTKAAKELFAKGNVKEEPEVETAAHFVIVSNLPKSRTAPVLSTLEKLLPRANLMFSKPGASFFDPNAKIGLIVFNNRNSYVEYVKATQNRAVDANESASPHQQGPDLFLAAVDPSGGAATSADSEASSKKKTAKSSRKKKGEASSGPERTLTGVLAEQLGEGAAVKAGKMPRYLRQGLGAHLGSLVESGSPYYQRLRASAYRQAEVGWQTKAQEALGDQGDPEEVKAVGFSLVEFLATQYGQRLPFFVQGISQKGNAELDQILETVFGLRGNVREQFLQNWGRYVATRYRSR